MVVKLNVPLNFLKWTLADCKIATFVIPMADLTIKDKGAEGRGRLARRQRRLLIVEIEKRIMHYQSCIDLGQASDAQYSFGLVLYTLDRLYRAVERHAKITGEWTWLGLNPFFSGV